MEFKFDPKQDYQIQAIEAACGLLAGQPQVEVDMTFALGTGLAAVANRLDLDDATLLQNLQGVQEVNGIAKDGELKFIEDTIQAAAGEKAIRFPNFSVEQETGTGKTYVYIRTALEMFRRYGMRKFIVVVPSIAVREGVLKTLQMTQGHLRALYDNLTYRFYTYDSANLTIVRQFALSDALEIMVMTIDSFNRASNVIRQATDRLQGETPIHLVQTARPILILDEPQNMESELRQAALSALDPLMALRYSATHRNPYNVIFRLTPYEAYRQGLVKRIEVASVVKEDDENQVFLRLDDLSTQRNTITARVAVHKLMTDGTVKEQVVTVRPGDSLEQKAGRPEYVGYEVDEINPGLGFVRFANNMEVRKGEAVGADKDAIFEAQIRYTVEAHMRRQRYLRDSGIKVLSLFFIDKVDNYQPDDGIIRRLFVAAFDSLKTRPEFAEWKDLDATQVQAAYFAQRKRTGGAVEMVDTVSGKTKEDEAAFDLIMRDKERLLSFEEPVAFIFSHSALREGWDNPNVFQICTLNQTSSEVKKRKEVGRGVRLARNSEGDVVKDTAVNVLTVVANESYQHYVERLQAEIKEEYGEEGTPPPPPDARKKGTARLRKEYTLKPEFQELWERIKQKTRYAVRIDTEAFLQDVLPEIDKIAVRPPRVTVTKAQVEVREKDELTAIQMTSAKTVLTLAGRSPMPNLVDVMTNLMERTTPPVRLTRRTLLEVIRRSYNKKAAMGNPFDFASEAVRILKDKLADHLVFGIQYEPSGEWYEMSQLEPQIETWAEYMVPADRSVYDHVLFDSQVEREFVEGLEKRDDVLMYIKLPGWFTVPTPVGLYNPDWAIIREDRDEHGCPTGKTLYLVAETKSTTRLDDLRPDERRKITCGKRHFKDALKTDYKVLTGVGDLP